MRPDPGNRLYRKLTRRGFRPRHVAEVGVHRPATCHVRPFIAQGVRVTLVEPEPDAVAAIRRELAELPNVKLHEVAIGARDGSIALWKCGPSTFSEDVAQPPAVVNDGYRPREEDRITVPVTTFDTIDDGTIDLLSVDVEGAEWFVLERMVSRPSVVSLETHGARYVNPRLAEIERWMIDNDYEIWSRDRTDTVWVRSGVIEVGVFDRLLRRLAELRIAARRLRKSFGGRGR